MGLLSGWSLFGLSASWLVGLGLGSALLVTGLYLLRLRRRPVPVLFLRLFQLEKEDDKAERQSVRLRRIISWLLSLALVGLLLLSLGDPRPSEREAEGRSVVFLIDVSASMASPSSERERQLSRLSVAQERARQLVAGLGPTDRALVVALGARPRPVSAWSGDPEVIKAAIEQLAPQDVVADVPGGLALCRDALRNRPRPEVILLSDGAFGPLSPEARAGLLLSYEPAVAEAKPAAPQETAAPEDTAAPQETAAEDAPENVALSLLSARRYPLDPDRYEVLIEIKNTGPAPAEVEVVVREASADALGAERNTAGPGADEKPGAVVEVFRETLPPGGEVARSLSDLTQLERGLVADIRRVDGGPDALLADNRARALLAERAPLRVLVVGAPNTFLDAALLLDPSLRSEQLSADDYAALSPTSKEAFDVTLFDGVFPKRRAQTGSAFYLGAPQTEQGFYPLEPGEPLELFGFDQWDRKSEVFRFVDPYDVQVLSGRALRPGQGDEVLGRSGQKPILVFGTRPEGPFLALGFDPKKSDFVMRMAFPLFVHNALRLLSPRRTEDESMGFQAGRVWHFAAPEGEAFELQGPLGASAASGKREQTQEVKTRRLVAAGASVSLFGEQAGFYRARRGNEERLIAANFFDAAEVAYAPVSTLRVNRLPDSSQAGGAQTGNAQVAPVSAPKGFEPKNQSRPWIWLVMALCVGSFFEFWAYHRRWTV